VAQDFMPTGSQLANGANASSQLQITAAEICGSVLA